MAPGPSPVIPLMILLTLGLVIHGGSLVNSISLVSDAEQATLDFILLIPLLLLVHFLSEMIIVPLVLILVAFMISKMLLGPLVLILVVHFASVVFPSFQPFYERGMNESEGGLIVVLVVIFLILSSFICQGDGNKWGFVLIAMLLYFFCNLSQ